MYKTLVDSDHFIGTLTKCKGLIDGQLCVLFHFDIKLMYNNTFMK